MGRKFSWRCFLRGENSLRLILLEWKLLHEVWIFPEGKNSYRFIFRGVNKPREEFRDEKFAFHILYIIDKDTIIFWNKINWEQAQLWTYLKPPKQHVTIVSKALWEALNWHSRLWREEPALFSGSFIVHKIKNNHSIKTHNSWILGVWWFENRTEKFHDQFQSNKKKNITWRAASQSNVVEIEAWDDLLKLSRLKIMLSMTALCQIYFRDYGQR